MPKKDEKTTEEAPQFDVVTRALTPEEAAKEAVEKDAASTADNRHVDNVRVEDAPPNRPDITFNPDGTYTEVVNKEESDGLPIAVSGDDNFAKIVADSANYDQSTSEKESGEKLAKKG